MGTSARAQDDQSILCQLFGLSNRLVAVTQPWTMRRSGNPKVPVAPRSLLIRNDDERPLASALILTLQWLDLEFATNPVSHNCNAGR